MLGYLQLLLLTAWPSEAALQLLVLIGKTVVGQGQAARSALGSARFSSLLWLQ